MFSSHNPIKSTKNTLREGQKIPDGEILYKRPPEHQSRKGVKAKRVSNISRWSVKVRTGAYDDTSLGMHKKRK